MSNPMPFTPDEREYYEGKIDFDALMRRQAGDTDVIENGLGIAPGPERETMMTEYLEATQALYQEAKRDGWLDNDSMYAAKRHELFERYATPLIIEQGAKFLTTDILDVLGIDATSLGQEREWTQALCERMTRRGPINGRMLFQSKDRPRRFFWIVDEE